LNSTDSYSYLNSYFIYPIKAILFDLSGTLVNDLLAVYFGYRDLCKRCNKKMPTLRQFRKEFKLPYTDFLYEKGFDDIQDAIDFWSKRYSYYKDFITLFSDVKPTLNSLKGIKLGIVSQTPEEHLKENLKNFGIPNFFDAIICDKKKPEPDGLLLTINELYIVPPAIIIYVGDMREDVIAAWRATIISRHNQIEFLSVAIYRDNGGFHDLETLKQGNPAFIIESLTELIPMVQSTLVKQPIIEKPLMAIA